MKKNYDVVLRGHHLMVLYVFYFLGGEVKIWEIAYFRYKYSEKIVENLINILRKITKSNVRIRIIDSLDDVCKKCNYLEDPSCNDSRIHRKDTKIAIAAGLKIGNIYNSRYILKRLQVLSRNKRSIFYIKTVKAKL